ncbi:MAG: ThiF family adenylyltransferase, partial [bacterium]|nr:ThiF family adenylyltransferase [bacterium]
MTASEDYLQRFGGLGRLYGTAALPRLHAAHVCVVGVGGVGSWVVEGLARSGIGALTLIDLDDVCLTNVNRQLP